MKRVAITYQGAVTVLAPAAHVIEMVPDRDLSSQEFYADAILIDHGNFDCGGGEGCTTCHGARKAFDSARDEFARREAAGIHIEDPDEPTLEERLGPYGIEWQIEQRERAEGRA